MSTQIDDVFALKAYFSDDILYDLENMTILQPKNKIENIPNTLIGTPINKEKLHTHETEETPKKQIFLSEIKYKGKASNGFVMLFKGNVFEYKKVIDTLEILCTYYHFKLSECAVIDINENKGIPLKDILEKIHTKYLLSWDIHNDFLSEINPYQITLVNNIKVIKVDAFGQVMNNKELKQKMNVALKTAFN